MGACGAGRGSRTLLFWVEARCNQTDIRHPHGVLSFVSLAGIEPAAPDLGGLGLSFSRDVVHAAGIEPTLLFRVMEALSHLAQRAWGERRDSNPP